MGQELPEPQVTEKDGIITSIEYAFNDDGKKIKITRRIQKTKTKEYVSRSVAERKVGASYCLKGSAGLSLGLFLPGCSSYSSWMLTVFHRRSGRSLAML